MIFFFPYNPHPSPSRQTPPAVPPERAWFRSISAPFGSVRLRLAPFGSVSGLFRVRFGSVSGVLGGVVVGSVRGASVRTGRSKHLLGKTLLSLLRNPLWEPFVPLKRTTRHFLRTHLRTFCVGASQMTRKFLTIKFVKIPNFIVMEFPRRNSVLGQFSVKFPLPNPLQNAHFINIVVSASLILLRPSQNLGTSFSEPVLDACVVVWPLRRAPNAALDPTSHQCRRLLHGSCHSRGSQNLNSCDPASQALV